VAFSFLPVVLVEVVVVCGLTDFFALTDFALTDFFAAGFALLPILSAFAFARGRRLLTSSALASSSRAVFFALTDFALTDFALTVFFASALADFFALLPSALTDFFAAGFALLPVLSAFASARGRRLLTSSMYRLYFCSTSRAVALVALTDFALTDSFALTDFALTDFFAVGFFSLGTVFAAFTVEFWAAAGTALTAGCFVTTFAFDAGADCGTACCCIRWGPLSSEVFCCNKAVTSSLGASQTPFRHWREEASQRSKPRTASAAQVRKR